ncbi:hypothetical protein ACFV8Z_43180, partial [Streptomyces sp. NPDC059837]|uniref:hypothetical protein n=1 Tax=Streptomyces sp. NPDC059837 TaxID=3346968 RepID=UPI003659F778
SNVVAELVADGLVEEAGSGGGGGGRPPPPAEPSPRLGRQDVHQGHMGEAAAGGCPMLAALRVH